jgi:hypothetical protein
VTIPLRKDGSQLLADPMSSTSEISTGFRESTRPSERSKSNRSEVEAFFAKNSPPILDLTGLAKSLGLGKTVSEEFRRLSVFGTIHLDQVKRRNEDFVKAELELMKPLFD